MDIGALDVDKKVAFYVGRRVAYGDQKAHELLLSYIKTYGKLEANIYAAKVIIVDENSAQEYLRSYADMQLSATYISFRYIQACRSAGTKRLSFRPYVVEMPQSSSQHKRLWYSSESSSEDEIESFSEGAPPPFRVGTIGNTSDTSTANSTSSLRGRPASRTVNLTESRRCHFTPFWF
ncbi:hypothetical protein BKA62DRAFT_371909 [Auriculariales sp. MPI-PUGE-AT-0066]|nr:hypothetical protein BKA62DRAFT_371909 [Auriculariales sp. MPI-PUGE-AT-0066]